MNLYISFFFITKSLTLRYVPNQALSDQTQAVWIDRQCFPMRNKSLFMHSKWKLWKLVLWNPQIETWTLSTNQISLHFIKSKTKFFKTHANLSNITSLHWQIGVSLSPLFEWAVEASTISTNALCSPTFFPLSAPSSPPPS